MAADRFGQKRIDMTFSASNPSGRRRQDLGLLKSSSIEACDEEMAKLDLVEARELRVLEAWLSDFAEAGSSRKGSKQVAEC